MQRVNQDDVRMALEDQIQAFLNGMRFANLTPDQWDEAFAKFRRHEPLRDYVRRDLERLAEWKKGQAANG